MKLNRKASRALAAVAAAGLIGIGAIAAAAPASAATEIPGMMTGPLFGGSYSSAVPNADGTWTATSTSAAGLAAWAATLPVWTYPAVGKTGTISFDGQCLTAPATITAASRYLVLSTCDGSTAQQFTSEKAGNGGFALRSKLNSKSVGALQGINTGTTVNGAFQQQSAVAFLFPGANLSYAKPAMKMDDIVISSPASGNQIPTKDVTFTGTAEPGEPVVLTDGAGNVIGSTTADAVSGAWSVNVAGPLATGPLAVTAAAAGNSTTAEYLVATPPAAELVITSPTEGTTLPKTDIVFGGTGEPGETIQIKDAGGKVIATGVVDDKGDWTATVPGPLAGGDTTFRVEQGDQSKDVTYTVADADLIVTGPGASDTVGKTSIPVSGTAEPGASVTVTMGGETQTVTADEDGTWSTTIAGPLAGGANTITVTEGDQTVSIPVTVVSDPLVVTSPSAGTETPKTDIPFAGTAEPGATVTVTVDGKTVTATADGSGNWAVTVPGPLPAGSNTATVKAGDQTVTKTFDVKADDLVVAGPADGATGLPKTNVPVSGTSEPGATVTIKDADGNLLGTATADVNGNWSTTLAGPLPAGANSLVVSDGSQTVTVDVTVATDPLTVAGPIAGANVGKGDLVFNGKAEPGATVQVKDADGTVVATGTADANGNWSATVPGPLAAGSNAFTVTDGTTEVTRSVNVAADPLAVASPAKGSEIGTTDVTFTGTAEPGTEITVQIGGESVTVTADDEGNWTALIAGPLPEGTQTYVVTGGGQTVTGSVTVKADPAPVVPDLVLTSPAKGSTVDIDIVFTGSAAPGEDVTVSIAGKEITVTADDEGNWTATVTGVPEGSNQSYYVTNGRQTVGGSLTVKEGAVDPADPELTVTSPSAEDNLVGTKDIEFAGTAAPGATVEVKDENGVVIGSGTADDEGNWTLVVTGPLDEGDHTLKVEAGGKTVDVTVNASESRNEVPVIDPLVGSSAAGAMLLGLGAFALRRRKVGGLV